jgi:sugar phosphate isomerase/epimerase
MIGADPYAARGYQVLKLETHLHTRHSDGQDSVTEMLAACRMAGYDAVALTDHNTQSGLDEAVEAAARLGLILLPGVEVTTFFGHVVVLGVTRVPEWRDLESRGMAALVEAVHSAGGLVCVAHPTALGSPVCSGCTWEWKVDPTAIDLWEIFSAPRPHTGAPLALWRQLLAAAGRAAPVAAGDVHSVEAAARSRHATYVYVDHPTAEAVLDALRRRRLFASFESRLDFWLEAPDGSLAVAGERVAAGEWLPRVSMSGAVVSNVEVAGGTRCLYAELRDAQGGLAAISAPIWIATST